MSAALQADFAVHVGGGAGRFDLEVRLELTAGVLVLFGPSGAGKSLCLRALSGLVRPDRGHISIRGEVAFDSERGIDVVARRRRIGYVPQHHSLFPFKNAAQNVAFGLPRHERRASNPRVAALIAEFGLEALASARPADLSGGERQRVALARALAVAPRLLLLDEPFASIDRDGRAELRAVLRRTLDRHQTPAVFVTHSRSEALALADRVLVFERGHATSIGSPAQMLGAESIELSADAGAVTPIAGGRVEVTLNGGTISGPASELSPRDGGLRLSLRPEHRDDK